jgi:glycosyltransferase involved in cell wall biosynthesis
LSVRRVALVAPFGLRPKGTTLARVLPIGRVLADQGVEVRVVIPPWDDPTAAGTVQRDGNLEVVQPGLLRGPLGPVALVRSLLRAVDHFAPDVVHVFKPIGYSGLVGWLRASPPGSKQPLVVLDTDDLEGPRGWSRRHPPGLGGFLRGWQEARVIRAIPRVTVASRFLEAFVRASGVPLADLLWLPQGWMGISQPAELPPRASESPLLVWYTRFTEARAERAARLFAPLLRAGARLIVYGDEIAPGARARAAVAFAEAGVGGQVDWEAYRAGGIQAFLAEHRVDLALYPLDNDLANQARCPTKLVELMAAGVPVVAEAVGEAKSYLQGLETECLVPPGDPEALQKRAAELLADEAARHALGGRVRGAAQPFMWPRVAGGLLEWYERHLGPAGNQ